MSIDFKNKKLLKEWAKIKDSDAFPSFEEFAEFYYTNGEKTCFRINTNEPWSKDNFFFGEYSELLVYYKEEQPKKRIGQKFHSLTVLDVFWQEKDGKDTLFAKCKCDCGNEVIKAMDALTKGNARTCGCNRGRKKSTAYKKIIPISKELIDELWDYEKNDVDPETVDCESTQKYWWKNNHGNSFELSPFVFIKPDTQTSFPEQAIFFYLKEHFNDTINKARYITQYGEVVEIDVYIPSLNVGIEYDGVFWHKDKLDMDEAKNQALNNDGVYVIRIREEGLPSIRDFNGKTITREKATKEQSIIHCVNDVIKNTIDYVNQHNICIRRQTIELLNSFCLTEKAFISDRPNIYALCYTKPQKNNIAESCLIKYWDYDKNGALKPENVPINSNIFVVLTCHMGYSAHIKPSYYKLKTNIGKKECNSCLLNCCPAMLGCPGLIGCLSTNETKCQLYNDAILNMKYVPSWENSRGNRIHEMQIKHSICTNMLIENPNISIAAIDNTGIIALSNVVAKSKIEITEVKQVKKQSKKEILNLDEEDKIEKQQYRFQGLCQYCGSAFKKKHLIFGGFICVKCGKKKDY